MGTLKRGRNADMSGLETTPQGCQLREVVLEILGQNRVEDLYVWKETTSVGLVRRDEMRMKPADLAAEMGECQAARLALLCRFPLPALFPPFPAIT